METVFESNFLTVKKDKQKRIVDYSWKTESLNLTEEGFLDECRNILRIVLEERARFIIGDTRNLKFLFSEDAERIINKEMLEQIGDFVLKFAHIESADVKMRDKIEKTFDESDDELFQNRYFETYESALAWIMEAIK